MENNIKKAIVEIVVQDVRNNKEVELVFPMAMNELDKVVEVLGSEVVELVDVLENDLNVNLCDSVNIEDLNTVVTEFNGLQEETQKRVCWAIDNNSLTVGELEEYAGQGFEGIFEEVTFIERQNYSFDKNSEIGYSVYAFFEECGGIAEQEKIANFDYESYGHNLKVGGYIDVADYEDIIDIGDDEELGRMFADEIGFENIDIDKYFDFGKYGYSLVTGGIVVDVQDDFIVIY